MHFSIKYTYISHLNILHFYFTFYSDDELDMTSDEFKNINKICLSILQHITVNIDVIQIVKNLSVSALNTCQNGVYYVDDNY